MLSSSVAFTSSTIELQIDELVGVVPSCGFSASSSSHQSLPFRTTWILRPEMPPTCGLNVVAV
jgi:hypothetical protein